ncbi:MAG: dihydroorotase [Bacteroidales bacterium]|nr:dihydroorotase [Bacteroidales bacterium]
MKTTVISNARILNENKIFEGAILIENGLIVQVGIAKDAFPPDAEVIDAGGKLLIPGVIDCHVHFREPGLTHKADLETESRAAVAGGTTTFFEMPNTQPQTTTLEFLEDKYRLAAGKSLANYSFFLGASNDNLDEILKADPKNVCGVKLFFGASTGNMLVDRMESIEKIFQYSPVPVAAHCEDEKIIRNNTKQMQEIYGDDIPVEKHSWIRNQEACYRSTELAIGLAKKYGTRLHITHLSTEAELDLLDKLTPLQSKRITSEVCVHYLWFSDEDYERLGTLIKVNPAIKSKKDQEGLLRGLIGGKVDIVATDHAPHLLSEKKNPYSKAPSGTPLVQHSLMIMLELVKRGKISLEMMVEKMCHAPAICYGIEKRGFIRPGYHADLVLIDLESTFTVDKSNIFSKCGWSAFEGETFHSKITHTFVNGNLVYKEGIFNEEIKGQRVTFNR